MNTETIENPRPWYAEPYVWLVLAPLIAVIIAGFTTLGIAIDSGGDSALPGEYRNAGKLVALDAEAHRRSAAIAPGVSGTLGHEAGRLEVDFGDRAALPEMLQVMVLHPTLPERDLTADLVRTEDGHYLARFDTSVFDRGELHVYPESHAWRIVTAVTASTELTFKASRR